MSPLVLSLEEAQLLVVSDYLYLHRKISAATVRVPQEKYGEENNKKLIEALLLTTHYQPGISFWIKEPFRITYDEAANQTWIQYAADNRLVKGSPIQGRTSFARNGIYESDMMERFMSRGELYLTSVQVEKAHRYGALGQPWCWALTFNKRVA